MFRSSNGIFSSFLAFVFNDDHPINSETENPRIASKLRKIKGRNTTSSDFKLSADDIRKIVSRTVNSKKTFDSLKKDYVGFNQDFEYDNKDHLKQYQEEVSSKPSAGTDQEDTGVVLAKLFRMIPLLEVDPFSLKVRRFNLTTANKMLLKSEDFILPPHIVLSEPEDEAEYDLLSCRSNMLKWDARPYTFVMDTKGTIVIPIQVPEILVLSLSRHNMKNSFVRIPKKCTLKQLLNGYDDTEKFCSNTENYWGMINGSREYELVASFIRSGSYDASKGLGGHWKSVARLYDKAKWYEIDGTKIEKLNKKHNDEMPLQENRRLRTNFPGSSDVPLMVALQGVIFFYRIVQI